MSDFKFKIGDTVRMKVHRLGYDADGNKFTPQILVVVERQATECYAGVQNNYGCRAHTAVQSWASPNYNFLIGLVSVTEPELEAYELPPLTAEKPPRRARTESPAEPDEGETHATV